ncbi:MAG TPA: serine/threonine-protein kinase [Stellaceae bacterium]|nr:serine/threonine-protein kinase [Stellaceae bacterium]
MADPRRPPEPDAEAATHVDADATAPGGERSGTRKDTGGSKIEPGLLLGHTWVVEDFLGRGGMGEVWRCRHIELGTEHAVKIILPELSQEPNFVALFKEEARRLSRLLSDAIVRYEGLFRDEWRRLYLVMEFVDGPSLSKVLETGRLGVGEIRRLLERIALGLAAAHEHGILHRDISPDNIILPERDVERAKIIDFGIAKSLDPRDVTLIGNKFAGKQAFVSPEQAGLFGGQVDARSDIYSLGLVLAAAALGHGRRLDMGSSPASIIQKRMDVPDLREIPPGLRSLIGWMLRPDPSQRPQSIRALLERDHLRPDNLGDMPAPVAYPSLRSEPETQRPPSFAAVLPTAAAAPLSIGPALSEPDEAPMRAARARARRAGTRWIWGALGIVLALGLAGAGSYYYYRGNPFLDLDAVVAEARTVASTSGCALLDVTGARNLSSADLRVGGIIGGAGEKERLEAALKQIPGVGRVTDATLTAPRSLCPILRTMAPLVLSRGPATLRLARVDAPDSTAAPALEIVQNGASPAFVYVDAFWSNGSVSHLVTNTVLLPGQQVEIDGKTLAAAMPAPPEAHGPAMISGIAASGLLLTATQSPESEDGARYATALKAAVDAMMRGGKSSSFSGAWLALQLPEK